MDDFSKYLKWRFGLLVVACELDKTSGYVVMLSLPPGKEKEFQTLGDKVNNIKIAVERWIENSRGIPVCDQSNDGYEYQAPRLKLFGSVFFIDGMLERLFGSINQNSEQRFIHPIDEIIFKSEDQVALDLFKKIVNTEKINDFYDSYIPLKSVKDYKEEDLKNRHKDDLLVGLAMTYRSLRSWCEEFDKVQYLIFDFTDPQKDRKSETYKANEMACQNGMDECMEYLELLGWK